MQQCARVDLRNVSRAVVAAWLSGGLVLAAHGQKFQAEAQRLHQEAMAAQKARGIKTENDPQLLKYPPAKFQPVEVQKVLPGGSLAIALPGTIPAGAAILSRRDGAVLAGAALTGTSYSARMTVGPNEAPGFVNLHAFTPVSHSMTTVPVAFIDTVYRFDLKSASGIEIKVIPTAKTFSVDARNATLKYQVEFYKAGEAKPFETRVGTMSYNASDDPKTRLDIPLTQAASSAVAEMEEINKQLVDQKLTDAQRNVLAQRLAKAQQRMMDEIMKAGADPAATQKKTDDFGCYMLQVYPSESGAVKGMTVCGRNFNGGRLETAGTMTRVK